MSARVLLSVASVVLAIVAVAVTGHPAHAQVQQPGSGTGLNDLVTNPGEWASTIFNAALVGLGQRTTGDIVGFMGWLLGSGNVISQTPPGLSYDSEVVKRLWGTTRLVADSGLAVATVWGGVNLMLSPHVRVPYHGALELVPRVLLSGILINTSLHWGHFVIDLNNALSQTLGSSSMPAWEMALRPTDGPVLLDLIAMAVYLVMGLLLLGQMLMRLALVDALLVIAPLALLCWVVPQTFSWARLWFTTFFGTVFVQSIQVLVLQLGTELIQQLPSLFPSIGSDPVASGRVWLVTLLFGVAVLQLARKVPRLMPGYPGGGGGLAAPSGVGSVRQISSLIRLAASRGAAR